MTAEEVLEKANATDDPALRAALLALYRRLEDERRKAAAIQWQHQVAEAEREIIRLYVPIARLLSAGRWDAAACLLCARALSLDAPQTYALTYKALRYAGELEARVRDPSWPRWMWAVRRFRDAIHRLAREQFPSLRFDFNGVPDPPPPF